MERDKFLTEARGECWHKRKEFSEDGYGTYLCSKCGSINYSSECCFYCGDEGPACEDEEEVDDE